jgi:hypothetical protein
MFRDVVKPRLRCVDAVSLELPTLFATLALTADQAGGFEDAKVLGDGLARHSFAHGQGGDRLRTTLAETGD